MLESHENYAIKLYAKWYLPDSICAFDEDGMDFLRAMEGTTFCCYFSGNGSGREQFLFFKRCDHSKRHKPKPFYTLLP